MKELNTFKKYIVESVVKENDKNDYANSEEDFTDEMVVQKILKVHLHIFQYLH